MYKLPGKRPKITGSKAKRKVLLKTGRRVIYASEYRSGGKPKTAVNVVTLYPPKWWHLDFIGDEDNETGEYRLTRLSPRRTRLDMSFTEHYKARKAPHQSARREAYPRSLGQVCVSTRERLRTQKHDLTN